MPDSIAAPVTNPTTVRLIFVLLCMNPQWVARIIDVEGAFLQGKFKNGEVIYTEVPDGMEEFYCSRADTVLLLNVPIYGTKQAANCFYDTLVKKLKEACNKRSSADPCLFFFWLNGRLVLFVSWVDDFLVMGHPEDVQKVEDDISGAFVAKSEGELKEYVGCKVDLSRREADAVSGPSRSRSLFWCKSLRMSLICLRGRRRQLLLLLDKCLCGGMGPER
jgi:hypothetical protein